MKTQLRLEAFYTFNERFAKIRSKRIKKAVKAITGNQSLELMGDAGQEVPKSRKKRRGDHPQKGNSISEKDSEESAPGAENNMGKSTPKQLKKIRVTNKFVSSEVENPESILCDDGGKNSNKISPGIGRSRGRGRKRLCAELTETSSSDGVGGNYVNKVNAEKLEGQHELRRVSLIFFLSFHFYVRRLVLYNYMKNTSNVTLDFLYLLLRHDILCLLNYQKKKKLSLILSSWLLIVCLSELYKK